MALQACSKSLKVLILRGCGSADIKREEIPILSSLEILELRQNSWLEDDFLLKAGEHFKRLKSLTIEGIHHHNYNIMVIFALIKVNNVLIIITR